jgi:hypothetical protein
MRVEELKGAELDYWAAKADGVRLVRLLRADGDRIRADRCETRFGEQWDWDLYMPSSAWMHGGPLIEKHNIGFTLCEATSAIPGQPYVGRFYKAFMWDRAYMQSGKTHLEAAMRMIVSHKYGPKVPDESI